LKHGLFSSAHDSVEFRA